MHQTADYRDSHMAFKSPSFAESEVSIFEDKDLIWNNNGGTENLMVDIVK
jgi:hypothetical protein